MQWLNPLGAWAFAGLLAVIALYILRREYREHPISSTYLWRKALQDQAASKPFQKLKSNLLMFIQLLTVALIALSLMRPMLPGKDLGGETVMIFDVSLSMQTMAFGQSRIDKAVNEATRMAQSMGASDRLTILTAGTQTNHLLTRSQDRQEAYRALASIHAENGESGLSSALSLAKAMSQEIKNLNVVVFSDTFPEARDAGILYVSAGQGTENCAVLSLTATKRDNGFTALARIANYGKTKSVSVKCFADDQLCDARSVEIQEGQTESVRFDIPEGTIRLRAELAEQDGLAADNVRHFVLREGSTKKIALIGEDNIFLEKAFSQRPDVELIRTTAADALFLKDCSLYVYDGVPKATLPSKGAFLILQPESPVLGVSPGEAKKPEYGIRLAPGKPAEAFSGHVSLGNIALKAYRPLSGGEPILTCGDDTLVAAGEENGNRFVVFGFNLHESNWVLQYDFPIFMMHTLNYLLPDVLSNVTDAVCGSTLPLAFDARTAMAAIQLPSGKVSSVAPPFPALPFTDTQETGIYTLRQTMVDGKTAETPFAVNVPTTESDVRLVSQSIGENELKAGSTNYGWEATMLLIFALLAFLMAEWWVSCRAG